MNNNHYLRTASLCAFALAAPLPQATAAYSLALSDSSTHSYSGGSDPWVPSYNISDRFALAGDINPGASTGPGSHFEIEIMPTVGTTYSYSLPDGITGSFGIWLNSPVYTGGTIHEVSAPTVEFSGATGNVPTAFAASVIRSGATWGISVNAASAITEDFSFQGLKLHWDNVPDASLPDSLVTATGHIYGSAFSFSPVDDTQILTSSSIPEPTSLGMLGLAAGAFAMRRRRRA